MDAIVFEFDLSRLPQVFSDPTEQENYRKRVEELADNYGLSRSDVNRTVEISALVGMLLLNEQFDETQTGFEDEVQRAWLRLVHVEADNTSRKAYYKAIADRLPTIKGSPTVFFQEFATVGDYVMEKVQLGETSMDHPNFNRVIELGLDRYVGGAPAMDSLTLPPLLGDDGHEDEIAPENIRAVGLLYSAYQLEQLRLFHVVDRITEMFLNGTLPVGFDAGGKALDTYYWNAQNRLDEQSRLMQYSRVLGVPGGEVSREVQPNTEFNALFMRFIASIAEYDRQTRINQMFVPQSRNGSRAAMMRPLSVSDAQVRKAGRDLAANVSLYGWANTQFAARRINGQIREALDILKTPQIQKAFGVTSPWQVIERVATTEFGQAPNVVRYRTMAIAGNRLLELVARNANAWSAETTAPLFGDQGDISREDYLDMVRQAEYYLAVNGYKEEQVGDFAQPELAYGGPSIPTFAMPSTNGNGRGASTPNMDQLRSMISAGQTPSMDQLRSLVGMQSMN
jgi:hypothetical protein